MPRFDGTGPASAGPMTGRGLGYCVLKGSQKDADSGVRGYAGLKGVPVNYFSEEPQIDGKEAISMPRGDRTGPMGMGPRTGRAAGYCAGYDMPGYMNPIPGRGFWGSGGWGRGWRHWYHATGLPGWVRAGWGIPSQFHACRRGPRSSRCCSPLCPLWSRASGG